MRTAVLLLLLVALVSGACDSASPVAPEGSILTISANPVRIPSNGQSEITVVARKANGFPVNEGTMVFLSTTRGSLPSSAQTDRDGVVRVTLRGSGAVGTAVVKANAGAAEEAMVEVEIGLVAGSVTLQASPSSLPATGGEIDLLALVRDTSGQPAGGVLVNFTTEVGTLDTGGDFVRTDSNGRAEDVLDVTAADLRAFTGSEFEVGVEVPGGEGELITRTRTITIQRTSTATP